MKRLILAAATAALWGTSAWASPIERACKLSNRNASAQLCGCIQDAADLTLTQRDQTRAARFFRDPQEAQKVRQSGRRGDEAFWQRYRAFSETAEAFCAGT